MIKNILIFTAGVGAGFGLSYFFFKENFKAESEKKAQEEISKMLEAVRKREEAADMRVAEADEKLKKAKEESLEIKLPEVPGFSKDRDEKKQIAKQIINYSGYSLGEIAKETAKETEQPDENDDVEDAGSYPKEGLAEKPYIISDEEYRNTCPYHSKESLFYYPDRGIVCDEEDIPLDPLETGLLGNFGDTWDDASFGKDGRIFIRNERAAADFELIEVEEEND